MAGLVLRGRGQNLEIDAAPFSRARADLSEKHLSFTRCSFQLGYQDNVRFTLSDPVREKRCEKPYPSWLRV